MMKRLIVIFAALCYVSVSAAQEIGVVPVPQSVEIRKGSFNIRSIGDIVVSQPETLDNEALFLKHLCSGGNKSILLSVDDTMDDEDYELIISPKGINISGGSNAGVFYGIQTLLQMAESSELLPFAVIKDSPRYKWRGFMIDESRHFFGEQKVKQTLDVMARYKLNKFHWHLTDEPAWRIEIKGYPKLATLGGSGSHSNPNLLVQYYTQEQIKDIIDYASARHIEVIPEIDMPGHATSANRAYPFLSGGGTDAHPDFTFNPGKDIVYEVLSNVLKEVCGLFPSKYIHIGGDEVSFGIEAWKNDKDVQALMKREGFSEVKEAERYFIHRMTDSIKSMGAKLIGWDELLEINADPKQTTIMWWRHDRVYQLKKALENDYKTILCPRLPLYFDFVQHDSHKLGRRWNGFCSLEDVYTFPDKGLAEWGIGKDKEQNIIGIQANLWTEVIHNQERFDYMTYPRIAAMAESAWSNPNIKNFQNFEKRMNKEYKYYDMLNIKYFNHKDPASTPEPPIANRVYNEQ